METRQLQDLVIFHYHLLPGGVTDVIRLSLQAFYQDPTFQSIKIVCGRNENISSLESYIKELRLSFSGTEKNLSVHIIPQLDYLTEEKESEQSDSDIKKILQNEFGGENSVWLVHNYHLGKNWQFTKTLLTLAEEENQKMIFQIHDFPECGRFTNLEILKKHIKGSLYSPASSIRYCVINKRDFDLLSKAGLPSNRLFLLENPLPEGKNPEQDASTEENTGLKKKLVQNLPPNGLFYEDGDVWLYPVRSIRRKNILEGGFIASLMEKPVNLIVTLPGISPQEKSYSDLSEKAFAEGLIPGFWGTGLLPGESGITYKDMIQGADSIFSSSVQEGFGYMYLNAIVWNKPLIARYLDIMGGFIPLLSRYPSHLYQTVRIPDNKKLKESLRIEYNDRFCSVRPKMPEQLQYRLKEQLEKLLNTEGIDFSYLSPANQYTVLKQISSDTTYKKECRKLNSELLQQLASLQKPSRNQMKTELYNSYGMESYGKAFSSILSSFAYSSDPEPEIQTDKIDKFLLIEFARLEYMRLLYK